MQKDTGKVWKILKRTQSGAHAKPSFGTGLAKTFTDSVKDRALGTVGVAKRNPETGIDSVRNATGVTGKALGVNAAAGYGDRGESMSDEEIDRDLDV